MAEVDFRQRYDRLVGSIHKAFAENGFGNKNVAATAQERVEAILAEHASLRSAHQAAVDELTHLEMQVDNSQHLVVTEENEAYMASDRHHVASRTPEGRYRIVSTSRNIGDADHIARCLNEQPDPEPPTVDPDAEPF